MEVLLIGLGAESQEGSGSRVGFSYNGINIVIHRHLPRKETDRDAVKSVRCLLTNAGVKP